VIRLVGIDPYRDRLAAALSGGWKQRLSLAAALMHEPRVVFLDEPTAGIDPVARRELWNLLFEMAGSGVTLLVSTHYMDEAERCGRVGYLYYGRMLVEGDPADLTRLPEITPVGTRRVEADCERGAAAVMGHARQLPYVDDVTIFGNALHLLVRAEVPDTRIAADLEATARARVVIRPIEASLEDVFVRLTKLESEKRPVTVVGAP
jgi:ABC-type multidrug transport system ATPase subunit